MYIKFEKREEGRRFTYFPKEREINGEKVLHTDKCVFATLSDGVKVGEKNGRPIWENDNWQATFCGKAYQKALTLQEKDRISVTEMNVRNVYVRNIKKSFPQIMVTDFDIISQEAHAISEDGYMQEGAELPFD